MYFRNRAEAGRKLAAKLEKYRTQNVVIIALGAGSSIVAAQIAMKLHANMVLYLIKDVILPGENEVLAGVGTDTFTYNNYFSAGQLEEFTTEYHQYIEQQRFEKFHELNLLLGEDGEINKDLIRHRTVILVADGLATGFSLNVAADFLKSIAIKKLVIATPVASVSAVDRMHLIADEMVCLSVMENYMGANHYYDDNTVPPIEGAIKIMHNISLNWEHKPVPK